MWKFFHNLTLQCHLWSLPMCYKLQLQRLSFYVYVFLFLFWLHQVLVAAGGAFSLDVCSMCDLVPWPGIEPRPPALGAWSLSHWTTGEVLKQISLLLFPTLSDDSAICSWLFPLLMPSPTSLPNKTLSSKTQLNYDLLCKNIPDLLSPQHTKKESSCWVPVVLCDYLFNKCFIHYRINNPSIGDGLARKRGVERSQIKASWSG